MAKKNQAKTTESEETERPGRTPKVRMVSGAGPVSDIYADGVSAIMTRAGVVKLDLYEAVGYQQDTGTELRRVAHRLVMPAAALPELMRMFQNMARAAQGPGTKA
jgi:hypothetical protein